ncbi:hypothetical protein D9M71_574220 [compost metagenome]
MHEDRQGVHSHRNGGRLVAVLLLEGLQLDVLHLAAHRAEVGGTFGQRRRRGGGTGGLDLDVHVRVEALVLFGPHGHQVGQGIGADAGKVARYTAGLLVIRKGRIDCGNRTGGAHACGDESQCRHQTLEFHALLLEQDRFDGSGASIVRPHEDSMTRM